MEDQFQEEMRASQSEIYEKMAKYVGGEKRKKGREEGGEAKTTSFLLLFFFFSLRGIPSMCPKAYRWVGEMEEISKTYKALGMTGRIYEGAAELFQMITDSPLGHEVVEDRNLGQTMAGAISVLIEHKEKVGGEEEGGRREGGGREEINKALQKKEMLTGVQHIVTKEERHR